MSKNKILDESDANDDTFADEYSQLNTEFTEVQGLIQEYKASLQNMQKNTLSDIKNQELQISELQEENEGLLDLLEQTQIQKQDLQRENKQLQTRNQGLILEIQNLEAHSSKLEQKLASRPYQHQPHNHYPYRYQEEVPADIQNQYELLIDRIVKELEYERNMKKKMSEEIKRLSQELMLSEKEIMEKNKCLYEMEMKMLKQGHSDSANTNGVAAGKNGDGKLTKKDKPVYLSSTNNRKQQRIQKEVRNDRNQKNEKELRANTKNFALLELINGELEDISNQERKIIGIKLTQFYERKIEREDYSSVAPENLRIIKFSHSKPELLSIQKVGETIYESDEKTEQNLVWNLAFILDTMFATLDDPEEFTEISEFIGQIIDKKIENSRKCLVLIKELLWI